MSYAVRSNDTRSGRGEVEIGSANPTFELPHIFCSTCRTSSSRVLRGSGAAHLFHFARYVLLIARDKRSEQTLYISRLAARRVALPNPP